MFGVRILKGIFQTAEIWHIHKSLKKIDFTNCLKTVQFFTYLDENDYPIKLQMYLQLDNRLLGVA